MSKMVQRYEDMSPTGRLQLCVQSDGDVIVTVIGDVDDLSMASVEFCMPMTGGGQSAHTHKALRDLAIAMQKDEDERKQDRLEIRRGSV